MSRRTGVLIGIFAVVTGIAFADIFLIMAGSVVMAIESANRHKDETE
jgi:hypothetical protein